MLTSCAFFATAQSDTSIVKEQKGFLFLTNYNYQYDWIGQTEIRPLGFHDFFFPVSNFDSTWFAEPNIDIAFKNGLRVDYINNRLSLKQVAHLYKGKDASNCYEYDQFYVIPVTITYKQFKDYEPLVCSHNYFDIQIMNGASLHFEYQHQAIKPIGIKPLVSKKKATVNLKSKQVPNNNIHKK